MPNHEPSLKERVYNVIRDRAERGAKSPSANELSFLLGCSPELAARMVSVLANEGRIEKHKTPCNTWIYGIGEYWTTPERLASAEYQLGKVGATMEEGSLAMSEAIDAFLKSNPKWKKDNGYVV